MAEQRSNVPTLEEETAGPRVKVFVDKPLFYSLDQEKNRKRQEPRGRTPPLGSLGRGNEGQIAVGGAWDVRWYEKTSGEVYVCMTMNLMKVGNRALGS